MDPAAQPADPARELETLRRALEQEGAARRAAEERADLAWDFIENGSIGLHWVDPEGIIRWANRAELEMLGYAPEEYIGRPVAEFCADPHLVPAVMERLRQGETVVNQEVRLRCRDGSVKHVLVNSNVCWKDGRFHHSRCFVRDITEIKRQGLAMRESEARYRTLIEQANDAIFVADAASGVILDANRRAAELLGRPVEALVGLHFSALHPPQKSAEYAAKFHTHAAQGGGRVFDGIVVRHADGRDIPVEISASAIAVGGRPAIQGIFRDVTERVRAAAALAATAAELARSNAELEMFAATASHDLQEPLRVIASYSSLLSTRHAQALDERAHGYLRHIAGAASRMGDLVRALLAYARVGHGEVELAPVSLLTALHEALENLQDRIRSCGAAVSFDDLPVVHGHRHLLVQLLQNLLDNAMKFCDGPPQVRIEAQRQGPDWVLQIADNGVGMDEEQVSRLFGAFQRLHGSRFAGTGLGLATCKKIVERHGDRIWVASAPGQGSTFRIALPAP